MAGSQLEVTCESCGATVVVAPEMRTVRCAYCDSPAVVDRPASADRPDPVFVIPFRVDRVQAAAGVRESLKGRWLAPAGLRAAAAEQVRGIYVPAYLYSAVADSLFSALIGEEFTTTRIDPRTRKVRRVREVEYHELKGVHGSYLTDIIVTASKGLTNAEIEAIEPYDLAELMPYSSALLSGWISEEPTLTRDDSLRLARDEAEGRAAVLIERFMPGDSHRNLKRHTMLRQESDDLILLPVWVLALRHHPARPPVRFVVNGQSGKVWGKVPVSWAKVALIAAVTAGLLGLATLIGWLL